MNLIQELLLLNEAVTPDQANAGIKTIVDDFIDNAERIMPPIDEWEQEIEDKFGDDPPIQVFKDEVAKPLDSYLDHFMEYNVDADEVEMYEYIRKHMLSDIIGAIAQRLKANYKLRPKK